MDRIGNPVPQWAMIGIDAGDHVRIMASAVLTQVEIEYRYEELSPDYVVRKPVRKTRIVFEAVDVVMVAAPDYPAALAMLFREWSPTPKNPEGGIQADIELLRQIRP